MIQAIAINGDLVDVETGECYSCRVLGVYCATADADIPERDIDGELTGGLVTISIPDGYVQLVPDPEYYRGYSVCDDCA